MQLGWVDYSEDERGTIKELLKMLGDTWSLDELGVGVVRDRISDLLYPGTSVLQTRAKYYILIPELFKKAMNSRLKSGSEVRHLINSDQDKIAQNLRFTPDEETGKKQRGIIGGRSAQPVKMKPTRIYWSALRTTEILCYPNMSFDDACNAVASYNRKMQNVEIKTESADDGGDDADANRNSLILFNAPCNQTIDDFMNHATLDLTKQEAIYLCEQFLRVPVMKNTLMSYCLSAKRSFKGIALEDIPDTDMPEELKHNLQLAVEFADFVYGAYIVYNHLFFENGGEYATPENKEGILQNYKDWKAEYKGLPHREEIIRLVQGHEYYKISLRSFLSDFEAAVMENKFDEPSEKERQIIQARERFCKRQNAKIGRDFEYSPIQTVPMNYRHGTAQTIIEDILKGLGK